MHKFNTELLNEKYEELNLPKLNGHYCFANEKFVIIPMLNGHCIFLNCVTLNSMYLMKGYETVDEFMKIYDAMKNNSE